MAQATFSAEAFSKAGLSSCFYGHSMQHRPLPFYRCGKAGTASSLFSSSCSNLEAKELLVQE